MSPASTRSRTAPRSTRKKKSGFPGWLAATWPILLGILITPFAVRGASILAMTGPTALRLLYPYVVLVQGHVGNLAPEQRETLSQWILYGQFPAYGAVWVVVRAFSTGSAGPLCALGLHCVGVAAAIFLLNG